MEEPIERQFRKSSYSGNGGGDCVETGSHDGMILVRDTTNRDGVTLTVPTEAWSEFLVRVR